MSDILRVVSVEERLDQIEMLLSAFFAFQFFKQGLLEATPDEVHGLELLIAENLGAIRKRTK